MFSDGKPWRTCQTLAQPVIEKKNARCFAATRVFRAASALDGWLPPPLKLRRDKLGEGNQRSVVRCRRSAGENADCGSQLWRGLEPDFPLWRIRRQNVKGFAHVPGRTEEALLRWLSVNSSQSLGKSAESQTSGMVSDRGSPKMVVALSKATPCGWNFSAAR